MAIRSLLTQAFLAISLSVDSVFHLLNFAEEYSGRRSTPVYKSFITNYMIDTISIFSMEKLKLTEKGYTELDN